MKDYSHIRIENIKLGCTTQVASNDATSHAQCTEKLTCVSKVPSNVLKILYLAQLAKTMHVKYGTSSKLAISYFTILLMHDSRDLIFAQETPKDMHDFDECIRLTLWVSCAVVECPANK